MQNFAFDLQRFKDIYNGESNAVISGTSKADYISNCWDTSVSIDGGAGNDSIDNFYGYSCTINGGTGNDSICNCYGDSCTIDGGAGNDYIDNASGDNVTIDGGAGNDYIDNDSGDSYTIDGGAGNDSIYNCHGDSCTIDGGAGNDLISLNSYSNDNVIIYKSGDGKDKIYGFDDDNTLSISGGSYSTTKSGKNIIVTVDDGKISLIGAAGYISDSNIIFKQTVTNKWTLRQTTATYGTSSKTLVTVKGVKSVDGLNVSNKVVTVKAASLGTSKVTVSDGYTLKLGAPMSLRLRQPTNGQSAARLPNITKRRRRDMRLQVIQNR